MAHFSFKIKYSHKNFLSVPNVFCQHYTLHLGICVRPRTLSAPPPRPSGCWMSDRCTRRLAPPAIPRWASLYWRSFASPPHLFPTWPTKICGTFCLAPPSWGCWTCEAVLESHQRVSRLFLVRVGSWLDCLGFASQTGSFANLHRSWLWIHRARVFVLGPVFQQQRCLVDAESRASPGHPEMVSDTSGAWHWQPALHCRGPGGGHGSPRSCRRGRYSAFTQPEWDQDHPTRTQVRQNPFSFNLRCCSFSLDLINTWSFLKKFYWYFFLCPFFFFFF